MKDFNTQQKTFGERRTFTRVPFVSVAHGVSPVAGEAEVRVLDISRMGIRFVAPCVLASGTPLSVAFDNLYFDERPITLAGTAVWSFPLSDGYATGATFVHPDTGSIASASELLYAALADLDAGQTAGLASLAGE